jgi:hypothetical protein
MMLTQRGMGLVGVLVAVAILGIIAATLSTLYQNMTSFMTRSNVVMDAENFERYVTGVVSQQSLCAQAFRTAGGQPPVWQWPMASGAFIPTMGYADFDRIQVDADPAAAPAAVTVASDLAGDAPLNTLNNGLVISRFFIRNKTVPGTTNPMPYTTTTDSTGTTYRVFNAELVIQFDPVRLAGVPGGALKDRVIPLTVLTDNLDLSAPIRKCDAANRDINVVDCTAPNITTPTNPSSTCPPLASQDPTCVYVGYVGQVNATGTVTCKCTPICGGGSGGGGGTTWGSGSGGTGTTWGSGG